jgi:hypothetical protein
MMLREWEIAMRASGADRIRVSSVRKDEYTAEAIVARGLLSTTGESMEAVCVRLLDRCRETM